MVLLPITESPTKLLGGGYTPYPQRTDTERDTTRTTAVGARGGWPSRTQ